MYDGTIKRLVRDRGFGFVQGGPEGQEFFFHRSAVEGNEFDQLREGQSVEFDVESSAKGPRAGAVRPK
jgi:cold shock protein